MTVLGYGESGIKEGDRLRRESTGMRRGGPNTRVYWKRNCCLNAYGFWSAVKKMLYNNGLMVSATCVSKTTLTPAGTDAGLPP